MVVALAAFLTIDRAEPGLRRVLVSLLITGLPAANLRLKERGLVRWADLTTPDKPAMHELIHASCRAWLLKRCQAIGATLDVESLRVEGYERHRGKTGELRFSTIDYSGHLRVLDPATLQAALYSGVGHAKAFGCGLLLVRPAASGAHAPV